MPEAKLRITLVKKTDERSRDSIRSIEISHMRLLMRRYPEQAREFVKKSLTMAAA